MVGQALEGRADRGNSGHGSGPLCDCAKSGPRLPTNTAAPKPDVSSHSFSSSDPQELAMTSVVFRRALFALGAALGLVCAAAVPAAAQTKLKMVLNWKYQGPQGWFFVADDKGYFKQEGLDVTIDQGDGSATPIPKVASGAYDVGFGDINALIDFASKRPAEAPIAVYVMFNRPPFTVAVKSASSIKAPKDFEGKTLGGAANDGALKLFPAFCKTANIDCGKVAITNFAPNLREQMLMQGQVDGAFGYV